MLAMAQAQITQRRANTEAERGEYADLPETC